MKLRSVLAVAVGMLLLVSVSPVFAAVPTVTAFTVAATAVSPVPVTAFTATDDVSVVGYMITQTSTKPAASDSRWTANPWTSFTTTRIGAITLYAWAKDNANGVSSSKTAATNVVGTHNHPIAQVTGLTAALDGKANIAHNHDSVYQKKYSHVIVVSAAGDGDFLSPIEALNSITNAGPDNPYLVRILPGVYDLGAGSVQMKEYVDIEGSGENVTKISGTITSSGWSNPAAVVMGANNTELRFLTVENRAIDNLIVVIWNEGSSPVLSNVTVLGSTSSPLPYIVGVYSMNGAPVLKNLTISFTGVSFGVGIMSVNASPIMDNLRISTSVILGGMAWGIWVTGNSSAVISDSTISSGTAIAANNMFYGSPTVRFYLSKS